MLGRLATWLRLLGFDSSYGSHLSGRAIIRHARSEDRILLTRDHKLLRQQNLPPLLYIASDHFREQLRQVIDSFALASSARPLRRCSRCNVLLVNVDKDSLRGQVPTYTFETQSQFSRCPSCRRVYWPATHLDLVQRELASLGLPTTIPAAD